MSVTLGLDYAEGIDPAQAAAVGYRFVMRYVAPPDPQYDWKRLTAAERDRIWAAGLGIGLFFESTSGRALGGVNAGLTDGVIGTAEARKLGWPDDLPIFFADDTQSTADQVRPYFKGVAAARACCGVYGGIDVVDPLLADGTVRYGCQTSAWSNGQVSQTAHLYQRLKPTTGLQGSFDEEVLLRLLPMWTPTSQSPQMKDDDMPPIYQVSDGPNANTQLHDYGFGLVHIGPTQSAELVHAGVPIVPVSDGTYQAFLAPRQPTIAPTTPPTVDVTALAAQLASSLGPSIGKQLVTELGQALTQGASS